MGRLHVDEMLAELTLREWVGWTDFLRGTDKVPQSPEEMRAHFETFARGNDWKNKGRPGG